MQAVFFPAVAVCWLVWLTGQGMSDRRSSGERRLQLKWLLSGATFFVSAGIVTVWIGNATGIGWKVVGGAAAIGLFALPVSIGLGLLKFRLYDIDRILSGTVAYVIVTALLIGVYAGLVLLATQVFRFHNAVAVAAATLVAAALFNPVRHRIQHAVDLGTVHADLCGTVDRAREPAHVTVWTAPAATSSRPG